MSDAEEDKMTTEFDYLKGWILDFLSKPQKMLNGFSPCPYARKALVDNKIWFYRSSNYTQDIPKIFDNWDDTYDVLLCVVDDHIDPKTFVESVKHINDTYREKGFICLEDHKDIPEPFYDIYFNNGKYNIILCQRTEKINQAANILLDKGYYQHWTKELYDDVVSWRM